MITIPQRRCATVLRNKKVLGHVIIFLPLFSIALWHAAQIINGYMYDNRYTLVKPYVANNTFPFLENITVQIKVDYHPKSIFQTQVDNGVDLVKLNSSTYENFVNQILINLTDTNAMSLDNRRTIAALFSKIGDTDKTGLKCIAYGDNKSCSRLSKQSYLDNLLRHSFYVRNLEVNLQKEIRKKIFYQSKNSKDLSTDVTLIYLNENLAIGEVDLSSVIKPQRKTFDYLVGVIADNESLLIDVAVKHKIIVSISDESFPGVTIEKFQQATRIVLRINNVGIYDKRKAVRSQEECGNEHPVYHPHFSSEPRCTIRQYLEIVAKECECLPFSYKRLFKISNKNLAYCTTNTYSRCYRKARDAYAKKRDCLPLCVTLKNQYSFSWNALKIPSICRPDKPNVCSLAWLVLECNDLSYTIFEQRFQLTLSQLLSHVGGDFGLYTGISILGVCQFFVYIYNLYQRRKKSRRANKTLDNAVEPVENSTTDTIFAILGEYFDGRRCDDGPDSGDNKGMQTFSTLSETKSTSVENEIVSVKKNLAELKTETQAQFQRVETQMQTQMQLLMRMRMEMQDHRQHIQQILHEIKKLPVASLGKHRQAVVEETTEMIYRL